MNPGPSSRLQFRAATVADSLVLAEMNQQLIRDEGHRNPMTLDELRLRMDTWLLGDYRGVLFECQAATVGYALYRPDFESIYVRHFFICPPQRRRGYGRLALEWLHVHEWDGRPLQLDVLVANPVGLAFWKSVGFHEYCVTLEHAGRPTHGATGATSERQS